MNSPQQPPVVSVDSDILSNSLLVRTYMHNGTRFGRTAQGYGSLFVIYSCVHDVVGILKRLAEMMTH